MKANRPSTVGLDAGYHRLGQQGFSLIEMSVVLVIAGLLLTVGVTVMKSLMQTAKIGKEKGNIIAIKNSLTAYALSRGHLPCPDTAASADGLGNCPVATAAAPYFLPYADLSLSTATKDTWSLPYRYDVVNMLTQTNSENICVALYQLQNLLGWYQDKGISTACGANTLVCATPEDDANDGVIAGGSKGYYVAAYIASGGEDKILGGKNTVDGRREYEMSSNPYDTSVGRDDMVGELTFAEIADKVCTAQNSRIVATITTDDEIWLESKVTVHDPATGAPTDCPVGSGQSAAATHRLAPGQSLTVYYGVGCVTEYTVSYQELAQCDLLAAVYAGPNSCSAGATPAGQVAIAVTAGGLAIGQ